MPVAPVSLFRRFVNNVGASGTITNIGSDLKRVSGNYNGEKFRALFGWNGNLCKFEYRGMEMHKWVVRNPLEHGDYAHYMQVDDFRRGVFSATGVVKNESGTLCAGAVTQQELPYSESFIDSARAFISQILPNGTKIFREVKADFISGQGVVSHTRFRNGQVETVKAQCPSKAMWELEALRSKAEMTKFSFALEFALKEGKLPQEALLRLWGKA